MSQDSQEPSGPTPAQPQRPYTYPNQPQQQPYPGQPAGGQPQPYGQPYGQAQQPYQGQSYPQGQPYPGQGQSPYGGQPYPVQPSAYPSTYPAATGYGAPEKPKSAVLGIVGFAVVAVATILGCITAFGMGQVVADALVASGTTQVDASDLPVHVQEQIAASVVLPMMMAFVGLIGWVISIVATVTGRGRPWGITGIGLGVIGPIAMFFAFAAPLFAVAETLA